MSLLMVDPADEQRAWLKGVLAKTALAPTALAQKAGLSQPTLTRFLNDPEATHALSARTIAAVERASGMRYGPDPRPTGFRESEAAPFDVRKSPKGLDFVAQSIGAANGIDPWVLRSRALEGAGYLPGDVLIVDLNSDPKGGDVVCAQVYDWARSRAETVFRIYEPPYLVAATLDEALRRPFPVDNNTVFVKGVVITMIRLRQSRAVAA